MNAIVFVGPTLHGSTQEWPQGIERRPPAVLGDIACAVRERPKAIGLIDGRFGDAPSVWHRELLEAIDCGIAVYGAASLGAIRAAELHEFGMIGIGAVFESYRSGAITRDDAVLVMQAPSELGAAPITVALVDAEATIRSMPLSKTFKLELLRIARRTSYATRTWRSIASAVHEELSKRSAVEQLLAKHALSVKRNDSDQLIEKIKEYNGPTPNSCSAFYSTTHYDVMLASLSPSEIRRA